MLVQIMRRLCLRKSLCDEVNIVPRLLWTKFVCLFVCFLNGNNVKVPGEAYMEIVCQRLFNATRFVMSSHIFPKKICFELLFESHSSARFF